MYVIFNTHDMDQVYSFLEQENIVSIRDVQKNPSSALQGITRVMKSGRTHGFFLSKEDFEDLLEDFEALSSQSFRKRIREARSRLGKEKTIPLATLAKQYGISH